MFWKLDFSFTALPKVCPIKEQDDERSCKLVPRRIGWSGDELKVFARTESLSRSPTHTYRAVCSTACSWHAPNFGSATLRYTCRSKSLLVRQEARTQSGRRRLGSVTLARPRVRVRPLVVPSLHLGCYTFGFLISADPLVPVSNLYGGLTLLDVQPLLICVPLHTYVHVHVRGHTHTHSLGGWEWTTGTEG